MLSNLKPERVFYYFQRICEIPHGSGNTKKISDFCVDFARKNGLSYVQDSLNNIIIVKEASALYEKVAPVILQGHLDMVCEKTADCKKDMETEGLDLCIDGDKLYAKGTTLGGDDGIAIAMILAILEDKTLKHPKIEAVFTVDEETGLLGAAGMDVSSLQSRRMINLDSEKEGIFTVSCAGGNRMEAQLPVNGNLYSGSCYQLRIFGLEGGHSGVEIHKQRANANVLMARLLYEISKAGELRLISLAGGLKDNVIPLESRAIFTFEKEKELTVVIKNLRQLLKKEFQNTDPNMDLMLSKENCENIICYDKESTNRMITMLYCSPNGVQKMSMDIKGLVQSSLNLGMVSIEENRLIANFCVRSSVETERDDLNQKIEALVSALGGQTKIRGEYPAWEYEKKSALRDGMCILYEKLYGKKPIVEAVHAGLECGLFAGKIEGLDCVSIGPDLSHIHTTNESLSISSVERVYLYLCQFLEEIS